MTAPEHYSAVSDDADVKGLRKVLLQSFAVPEGDWEPYFKRVGRESFRILRSGDEIAGCLAILRMGQWFGGRRIPTAGIAAVGVAPESRGTGVAARLMENVVTELRGDGVPLSVLYPATLSLYRRSGYELAGTLYVQAVRASSIRLRDREYPIYPAKLNESDAFQRIATERAQVCAGHLDRDARMWEHLTYAKDNPAYTYLIGPKERPDGYLLFFQEHKEWGYDLRIRDMAALSVEAGRRLWSFLALHSSQCRDIYWRGPSVDPLLRLLPDPEHRVVLRDFWMLRILDVAKALEMRGYPENVEAELHIEVTDDVLAGNNGRYTVRAAGGKAKVAEGGRGDLRLDVRDLASLYSGMVPPAQLQALGSIETTPDAAITAAALFAGPEPWMSDEF